MTPSPERSAVLRTLAFHEAWGYAPTRPELVLTLDAAGGRLEEEAVSRALEELRSDGTLGERSGRIGFSDSVDALAGELAVRDPLQPRKRRRAVRVARWLARLDGVRFVALANTTALGSARDGGDLDFFVIVRAGTIWTSRFLGVLPFKLFGMLPSEKGERDAVCLSYFIADDALDLSSHRLPGGDPYFHQWFLALLPLADDGVSADLWNANAEILGRHPFARPWISPPDLRIGFPRVRIPAIRVLEPMFRRIQHRWFPPAIRERMNRDSTVVVDDSALKFHVQDGRDAYRTRYADICIRRGIEV